MGIGGERITYAEENQEQAFLNVIETLSQLNDLIMERVAISPIIMLATFTKTPDHEPIRTLADKGSGNILGYTDLRNLTKEQRLVIMDKYDAMLRIYRNHIESLE